MLILVPPGVNWVNIFFPLPSFQVGCSSGFSAVWEWRAQAWIVGAHPAWGSSLTLGEVLTGLLLCLSHPCSHLPGLEPVLH